jgi:hypothetical protein
LLFKYSKKTYSNSVETSTTPLCTVTDGMASNTIIPSSEINVSDKTVAVDNLINRDLQKKKSASALLLSFEV